MTARLSPIRGTTRKLFPYVILIFVFWALIVPLILRTEIDIYDEHDEQNYHYPLILEFSEQFPNFDFSDYRSATTPLYHAIMTIPVLILGTGIIKLRLFSSIFSLCCLLTVYGLFSKRGGIYKALFFSFLLSQVLR